ncbi:MAG: DUF302 domain-containing protein [Gammaproteobacteria bacterium]
MQIVNRELKARRLWLVLLTALIVTVWPAWGQEASPPPDFHVTVRSAYGFDETLERLKQAIEGENLMLLHEINPQQMLRMVGVRTGGMRQILFFHPRYMKQIFETNRNGVIEPPLKLVAMEMPDGRVMIRYIDPTYLFGRYDGLEEIGSELNAVVKKIVASVQQ